MLLQRNLIKQSDTFDIIYRATLRFLSTAHRRRCQIFSKLLEKKETSNYLKSFIHWKSNHESHLTVETNEKFKDERETINSKV